MASPTQLSAFDFELPADLIAQEPLGQRDAARLLHVTANNINHRHIYDLPEILRAGDVLVLNDSRVIPARLLGKKGLGKVELLLHRDLGAGTWEAFAKPARKLKPGDVVQIADDFAARVAAPAQDGMVQINFKESGAVFYEKLTRHGHMPLPPYIRKGVDRAEDKTRYQTVYAKHEGSVAAPTAGLHFTPELLQRIEARGVKIVYVTLHVGAGTFLPVKVDDITRHTMHAEIASISAETADAINAARKAGGRVVAVGTTATRVLETAAQDDGSIHAWSGETRIFITPGVRFKIVDCLITNFHLPKSTLFMLVAALMGLARMQEAYRVAITEKYRFFSYGDACFLERV